MNNLAEVINIRPIETVGFTGSVEMYDLFVELYNKFAEKLEDLGVDDEMFSELNHLCEVSRKIY